MIKKRKAVTKMVSKVSKKKKKLDVMQQKKSPLSKQEVFVLKKHPEKPKPDSGCDQQNIKLIQTNDKKRKKTKKDKLVRVNKQNVDAQESLTDRQLHTSMQAGSGAVSEAPIKKKKKKKAPGSAVAAVPAAGSASSCGELARLSVPGGFTWETSSWPEMGLCAEKAGDSSSDDEEPSQQQPAARPSRQELRQRAAAEELQLQERERRLLDPSRPPETADDHERLVVAHPDDSSLWIRFMSYFLQATEIEKARGVARRALKTINFREEDEKLNIYVAWLNLESMHGTQETLSNVLHEALQSNDTFKVLTRMAEIHAANNKYDEAEQMYSQLVRKMANSKEAWLRYGVFLMQVSRCEAARGLMQRALRCLDRRDHVEVISKFAQLEFRFGEPERGKTMFDHLLSTYPKRLDQWNVYISQLIKSGDHEAARQIFQRASTVRLNARRMRSLLKRFLEFEQQHGSAEQQEAVRELARQFVESRSDADAALLETER